jgi:hypothetical protein
MRKLPFRQPIRPSGHPEYKKKARSRGQTSVERADFRHTSLAHAMTGTFFFSPITSVSSRL